jgi:hypothetical protein
MGQSIPLGPIDSPHVVRRHRRPRAPSSCSRVHVGLAVTGLALAGVGAWLSLLPAQFTVEQDSSGYSIAGLRLGAKGNGVYTGQPGALIERADGETERAGASTILNGRHTTGQCVWVRGATHANCVFRVEDRTVGALDTRTPYGWRRRYEDGEEVDLVVGRGGAILVPFAVGLR